MRNFTLKICLLFFFISPFVAFGDVFIQTLEVGSYKAKFATHNLKKDQGIVVVLHGLLHEDDFIASVDPWIELQISSVGFVFPQGKTLAFNQSPLLGWGPNCLDKQVMFIKELFAHLQKQYRPKWVILAGFSNAAYLVNHFLLKEPENYFDGFWLQGAGMTTDHKVCEFRPFVYSVGRLDEANYIFCKQYASELSSWGYKEGCDFLFRIKKGGHKLDLSSFLDDLAFLLSAAKLRS